MLGFKAHSAQLNHPIDIGLWEGGKRGGRNLFFSSLPSLANTSPVNSEDDTTRRRWSSFRGGHDVVRYRAIGIATRGQDASEVRNFLKEFRKTSTVEQGSESSPDISWWTLRKLSRIEVKARQKGQNSDKTIGNFWDDSGQIRLPTKDQTPPRGTPSQE